MSTVLFEAQSAADDFYNPLSSFQEYFKTIDSRIFDSGDSEMTKEKYKISLPGGVRIVSYRPNDFSRIRKYNDVSEEDFRNSLCGGKPIPKKTNSKGSDLFMFTHDRKFLVKAVAKSERETLLSLLPDYKGLVCNHPSLLNRVYGLFKVTGDKEHVLVVLGNAFYGIPPEDVYDLKGSTEGRTAKAGESELKDNDWLKSKFQISAPDFKARFLEQVKKDTLCLADQNLMDYSLLIGISSGVANEEKNQEKTILGDNNNALSVVRDDKEGKTFTFSIIDFLVPYDATKIVANTVKRIIVPQVTLSTVNPVLYRTRFLEFLESKVFS